MAKKNAAWIVTGSLATLAVVGGTSLAMADPADETLHLWDTTAAGQQRGPAPDAAVQQPNVFSNETKLHAANPLQIHPARATSSTPPRPPW